MDPSEIHAGKRFVGLVERDFARPDTPTAVGTVLSTTTFWFDRTHREDEFMLLVDLDRHAYQHYIDDAGSVDQWPYETTSSNSRDYISGACDAANAVRPSAYRSRFVDVPKGLALLRPVCRHCGDPQTPCDTAPLDDDLVTRIAQTFQALITENCRIEC